MQKLVKKLKINPNKNINHTQIIEPTQFSFEKFSKEEQALIKVQTRANNSTIILKSNKLLLKQSGINY